jgi:competence protein ComEC
MAVSTAAYLATAPAVASHFRWLAPVGLVSNLLAVPLCTAVLGAGYGCVLFADVPVLGRALGSVTGAAARSLLGVASAAAAWEPGAFCVVRPSAGMVVTYFAVLVFYSTGSGTRVARSAAVPALALLAVLIHLGLPVPAGNGRAEIDLLDVGQGQAVAVRGPGGALLLVDTGGSHEPRFDPGESIVLPHLVERGGGWLAAIILTHGHVDHVGGAFAVLREIEVGQLWVGPGAHRDPRLSALMRLAHERGTAVVLAEAGSSDVVGGLRVQTLAPSRGIAHDAGNEASVVVVVGEPPSRLLVPGDLEGAGEQALIASEASLRAEALVVAHHGSRYGTSRAFLARIRPQWALISAGRRNPFGHPHAEVLERLELHGVPVLRTDELGSLRLVADQDGWRPVVPVSRCISAPE